ncbi:DHA2 family efflux MFS transporter permease subunit [Microbispora hainanensis]|uniref:DHA2 family efflux MFS transporter permease subunit n=1 Tax=Microbispora hainanensis TaxID=568844 RepID=UPI0032559929
MSVTSQDARASGPEAGPSARRWPALLVVLLAAFMDLVDNTIVTVGLPEIQKDLRATDADLQWVAAGYALAFALMLITGGRLGDVFGRKKTFLAGIVGFTIASALAGAAQGPETLIGARVLQGALAVVMIPQVLTYIQVGFSAAERPRALGLYGMVLALAGVSGPLLGGLLIDADLFGWDWRTIFLINVPIGAAAFLGTAALMPESRAEHTRRLDLVGVVLITLALVAVFYPLVQGRELGWPLWTFISMAAALPLLVIFVAYERGRTRRDDSPLVDLGLFRERGVIPGLVVALVFFTGGSFFFVLTLHLQIALGYTPLRAGLTFLPFAFGVIIGSGAATRLAPRAGRLVVAVGSVVMGGAVAGMIYTLHRNGAGLSPWNLLPAMVVAGIGLACVSATLVNIALARVSARHAGSASGVVNTTVQLGSAAGIAVIGTVFFSLLAGNATETAATVAVFLRSSEQALWVIVGLLGVSFLASFLLPSGPVKTGQAGQAGQADDTRREAT